MKNFGPRAFNQSAKANQLNRRTERYLEVLPCRAADIKAWLYEPLGDEDHRRAEAALDSIAFMRRNREVISAWTWLEHELVEYRDALILDHIAFKTKRDLCAKRMELYKEMLDCFGLVCHAFEDYRWLVPSRGEENMTGEFFFLIGYVCRRMIEFEKECDECDYLTAMKRVTGLLSHLSADFYAMWFDDKREKGYNMACSWVDDLFLLAVILSMVKEVRESEYLR